MASGIIADVAVGFLVETLKDLVACRAADLIYGSIEIGNARIVCEELEILQMFFNKCKEDCSDNDFLENLAKKVRNLCFRAEDAIESYMAIVSLQKTRGLPRDGFLPLKLEDIPRELETIKREVNELCTDLHIRTMKVDTGRGLEQRERIKKPPFEDYMVGFKDAMVDILELANGGPEDLQIISIVGEPGLGKTTIARKVFKHPTIEYQFSVRAFVVIATLYNTEQVFLEILRACGTDIEEMNSKSEDELVQAIKNHLEKINFFIVLDNIWSSETWDDLKKAFPTNQKRSRVLITTRSTDVAEYATQGLEFKPYNLRFLTNEESRELLCMRVFGKKDEIPSDLLAHESRILGWCKELPLAIVLLAGILTNYWAESLWWKKVAENVDNNHNLWGTKQNYMAQLSFSNLSSCLKPCFLYLGVFPEGSEIPSKTIVQLWISEGFIPAKGDRSSEDIAEEYLEELVDRSLVMVEKRRLNGQIKTIRIHDMLHEFCKAQGVKEEFSREIKIHKQGGNIAAAADDDRRLYINSNVLAYIGSRPSGKCVRSFLSFAREDVILPLEHTMAIPKAFKLLKVLDIRSVKLIRFPADLFYLFLLKYLAIWVNVWAIPYKVSNMSYLQTFMFNTPQHRIEMKADLWKMTQLRHLETNASIDLMKASKEHFPINENLQTLSAISPGSCREEVFDRAPHLKKLGVRGTLGPVLEATGQDSLFHSLSKLEFLENLKLLNDDVTVKLHSLPSENSFPKKLKRLTLQNTLLDWRHISTLGKLEKLEMLKLKDNAFLGAIWETENDGFCALKVLHIGRTDLIFWKASSSHFPTLTHLYLRHCTRLEAIPLDLVNVSTLQLMDIYCCSSSASTSARKIQLVKLQLQMQDKHDNNTTTMKLSIYPSDQ